MQLAAGHGWRSSPGHKILVLGRGAVRLEYPEAWVVEIDDDCVRVYDNPPPDDECVFGVSYDHWPAAAGQSLSVASLVRASLENDPRSFTVIEPIGEEARIDTALAWAQSRFIDPRTGREACARLCIAQASGIQALLTFDFWLSDLDSRDLRWNALLASLQLAHWVVDPQRGSSLS